MDKAIEQAKVTITFLVIPESDDGGVLVETSGDIKPRNYLLMEALQALTEELAAGLLAVGLTAYSE